MVWLCSWQPPSRRYPSRRLWSRRCLSTWCSSWSFRCSSFSPPSRCGCPVCLTLSNTAESRLVLVERLAGGVAKLTLNSPPLNLVTLEMTEQLIEALEELEGDEAVRAIVVTGAGDRAFCAGSDVKEFAEVRDSVVQKKLAREAERLGLAKEVVPDGEALPRALDVARSISRQPKEAVAAIKRGVRESLHSGRKDSVRLTLELSDHLFKTEDCAEGILAFFEKREPRFEGAPGTGD